jgi:hypothetical protein
MKRAALVAGLVALAVIVGLALLLSACAPPASAPDPVVPPVVTGNVTGPGGSADLSSAFATALACDASQLTWSISENTAAAPTAAGSVTSAGVFTAPACGSPFIGSSVHVVATGCGKTATAAISISDTFVSLAITAAEVTNPSAAACMAADPLNVTVRPGATVQFFVTFTFACHTAVSPALPSPLPGVCP